MGKFRKRPVVIEAARWFPGIAHEFAEEAIVRFNGRYLLETLENPEGFELTPGDWIIRGVKGEVYNCKPEIFDMTYEAVES